YPRNQSGDPTKQTAVSQAFGDRLDGIIEIAYQDESVTSIAAEDLLIASGKPYAKEDIDSLSASIILQDYLEIQRAAGQ
ncbi:Holliday junction resolvase RuvX, partial [Candidatus Saccharibacteria bacterium]|nr:Holliday junction resolvase RuvX [Candidatus Saccharibacteria bacterium]